MPSKLQPAFWGGLFIGVLSALPFVSALNVCCCLWVIAGGVLTSYLLQERLLTPLTAGDGAVGGLLAGLIGAAVSALIGLAFVAIQGNPMAQTFDQFLSQGQMPPEAARLMERMREWPAALWFVLGFAVQLILFPIFSMLGALLGVAIFKRNVPPPSPPGTIDVLPPEPPRTF
jgi:hypothetical protein